VARFDGDVTIEIGDERNRPFMWPMTKALLRGTWRRVNLQPDEMTDLTNALGMLQGDIPGARIELSGRRRRCRIYDPLDLPENASLWAEVKRLFLFHTGTEFAPVPEKLEENLNDTKIKTRLYWMRRLVNGTPINRLVRPPRGGPQAILVGSGALPTLPEIAKLPGRTQIGFYNDMNHHPIRFLEDMPQDERLLDE
jgi:hypothetical protein